jgi:hypothetical protein
MYNYEYKLYLKNLNVVDSLSLYKINWLIEILIFYSQSLEIIEY